MNLFTKMFGTHSERELKLIYPLVDRIEALRPEMQKMCIRDRPSQEVLATGKLHRSMPDRQCCSTLL